MILLVDAGNTRIKCGLHEAGSLTPLPALDSHAGDMPEDWRTLAAPRRVLISNVAGDAVAARLRAWVNTLWSLEPVFAAVRPEAANMVTRYDPPGKLGVDRWLAAIAGYRLARGAVVVVDAGTAVTIDVVDAHGVHHGGSIAPGLSMMLTGLTRNTAQLQLDAYSAVDGIAKDTASAISSGCADALVGGIERMHRRVAALLGLEPQWIITGGEARVVMDACDLAFRHEPDLVLHGLTFAYGKEE